MNKIMTILCCFVMLTACNSKKESVEGKQDESTEVKQINTSDIQGAWQSFKKTQEGNKVTVTTIVMGNYFVGAYYREDIKQFIKTFGGSFTIENDTFKSVTEFDTSNPARVGKKGAVKIKYFGDQLSFANTDDLWQRLDKGNESELANPWLITGRERKGELHTRNIEDIGPRKTMKILSGTRFQWIAYNTETGEFFGTGGGTYTAKDGVYTENIEFFSRDSSRVGMALSFDYKIEDGQWHHSGKSSKGDPIYEIWSKRP